MRSVLTAASLLALFATACASSATRTEIKNSWSDPAAGPLDFQKTIVVFMNKDTVLRKDAEVQLVGQIGPSRAVASYTVFGEGEGGDVEAAKRKLREAGFDGAVVMRLIGQSQEPKFTTGVPYSGPYATFYGYHGLGWTEVNDPSYLREEASIEIETTVFDLEADKLRWWGASRSFNSQNTVEMVRDLARAVIDELRRKKLIS